MGTDLYTLGALGMVLMCSWLANHASAWSSPDLARALRLQRARSAEAIRGTPHRG